MLESTTSLCSTTSATRGGILSKSAASSAQTSRVDRCSSACDRRRGAAGVRRGDDPRRTRGGGAADGSGGIQIDDDDDAWGEFVAEFEELCRPRLRRDCRLSTGVAHGRRRDARVRSCRTFRSRMSSNPRASAAPNRAMVCQTPRRRGAAGADADRARARACRRRRLPDGAGGPPRGRRVARRRRSASTPRGADRPTRRCWRSVAANAGPSARRLDSDVASSSSRRRGSRAHRTRRSTNQKPAGCPSTQPSSRRARAVPLHSPPPK